MADNVENTSSGGWFNNLTGKQKALFWFSSLLVVVLVAVFIWLGVAGKLRIGAAGENDLTVLAQLSVAKDQTKPVIIKNWYNAVAVAKTASMWIPDSDWNGDPNSTSSKFMLVPATNSIDPNGAITKYLEKSGTNDIKIYVKGVTASKTGVIYFSNTAGASQCTTSGLCDKSTGNPVKLTVNVTALNNDLTVEPPQLSVAKDGTTPVIIKNWYNAVATPNTASMWIPDSDWNKKFVLVAPTASPIGTGEITKYLEKSGTNDVKIYVKGLTAGVGATGAIYFSNLAGASQCETSGLCDQSTGDPVKLAVSVTEGSATACASSDYTYTFVPNAWNIKAYNLKPVSSTATLYSIFAFLGTEKPVRAYTYPGSGQAYLENGLPVIGEGYWFNSGAPSPVCVPATSASVASQTTAAVKSNLAMVGNPTGKAVQWSSVTITINGQTMSILEASNKEKPLVKAMFEYTPGASEYVSYVSEKYGGKFGGSPISTLMSKTIEPGNGVWIALNSGVTSATLNFK